MLKTIAITHLSDKKNILHNFEPKNSAWITSDIKSQLFILKYLKDNKKSLKKNSIFRAQDFWIKILQEIEPGITISSRSALCLIYQQWISESQGMTWQKTKETGHIVCEFISMMAHILQHPHQDSLMKEWWSSKKKIFHWKKWYALSQSFYSYLIEKKIIEDTWLDTYLLDRNIHLPQWKGLIFDMGADMNPIEVELISQLSIKNQITVLVPFSYKNNIWECTFTPYRSLVKTPKIESSPPKTSSVSIKKFPSMLMEIKDITVQVKKTLKTLKPSQVSVLAPNIEDYWPCLKSYLLMENIPFKKSETTSLISFPAIQLWLARMWTHLGVIEYENLETIQMQKGYSSTKLRLNYLHIKHIDDVPEHLLNKKWIKNNNTLTSAKIFINWAKQLLPNGMLNILQKVNTELLRLNTLQNIQMPFESWLTLLSSQLKQQEHSLIDEKQEGIHCLSTNALAWVDSDFIYLAGLSEQNLKTDKHHFISSIEADFINEDLGFIIKTQAIDKPEQNIAQFIQREHKNLILSFSATDFHGEPFNPSALWLEQAQKHSNESLQSLDQGALTLWDKQQQKQTVQDILSKRNMSVPRIQIIEQSIKEDKDLKPINTFFAKDQPNMVIKKLSASSLQDYAKCPFIFASKKLFKLYDDPQKDVDIDSAKRGSLIHKLFENINKNLTPKNPTPSDQELQQEIENLLKQEKYKKYIEIIHPIIQEKEKKYLLEKAKLFLKNEKKLSSIFKNLKTDKLELEYSCFWNQEKHCLDKQGDIEIAGIIDRIDKNTDNNTYFIIDYKGKIPSGSTINTWEKYNNFQMGIYMEAVELGLTDLPAHSVEQALYLSYKNFEWKGYADKTSKGVQLFNSTRSRSLASKEKKQEVLNELNVRINTLISRMKTGDFKPKPFKKSDCSTCRWRKICRAAHLN